MPRRTQLLNSLTRGRIRASWNKYNLFNLYKKGRVNFQGQNQYQQKWTAKQETRAYHGEHLTESRLQSQFSTKLESVANLDASLRGEDNIRTPIPIQTFAELEKRLDFALFRAMFASSIRQARQFILHGYVSVNGIRIRQPGFRLTAGDVFNVAPEKALLALGATKPALKVSCKVDNVQIAKWNEYVEKAKKNPKQAWDEQRLKRQSGKGLDVNEKKALEMRINSFNKGIETAMLKEQNEFTKENALLKVIQLGLKGGEEPTLELFNSVFSKDASEKALKLYQKTTSIEEYSREVLTGKSEEELKKLITTTILDKEVQASRKEASKKQHSEIKQLIASVQSIHWEDIRKNFGAKKLSKDTSEIPYDANWVATLTKHPLLKKSEVLEAEYKAKVNLPWQKGLYGRQEPKKPYFTPWKVRPFMAPFAILPSHIEISFDTCHAVYLRDPVASPGKSEVITPFNLSVHERAFMWYIRRVKTSKH